MVDGMNAFTDALNNLLKLQFKIFILLIISVLGTSHAIAADVFMTVNWPSYSGENSVQIFDATNTTVVSTPAFTDGTGSAADIAFSGSSTTYPLADNTTYTVRMTDTFGDGWNGNGTN